MNITFIGNCQTLSLCFYFQQLLNNKNYIISWICYGEEFKPHINEWSNKCRNKIIDYNVSIETIKISDIIIYQNIDENKSSFSNTKELENLKKTSCKLILFPCIYLIYNDFDNSIKELINRENKNNVDIKVSNILSKFKSKNLMLSCHHPSTFLFMEIIKLLCVLINVDFFTEDQYINFLKNENYMQLP